ncbi:hypothetical protein ACQ4PT_011970 [Festuca glaucescens]
MASLTAPRHIALLALVLALASTRAASAAGACAAEKFPAGKAYATCSDLPQLGAALHWTYDEAKSSLSVAFVAAPAGPNGWVAWGLNPTGEGMAGAQALVALKGSSSAGGAPAVKTYNITGYVPLGGASTPIAFPATELSADAGSGGKIRLYGKLQLKKGMKAVNQVWQVGTSVTGGAPDKHAFSAGNLAAKAKLVLSGKATAPAPAPVPMAGGPAGSAGSDVGAGAATTPAAGKSASGAASVGVSSVAVVALAVVGFLAVV